PLPDHDPYRSTNQYFLFMDVDPHNEVPETNESNNSNQGTLIDSFPFSSEANLPRPVDNTNVVAPLLAPGASVNGVLGDEWIGPYDIDAYRFDGKGGHTYAISLTAPPGITSRVYNASWAPLTAGAAGYVPAADGSYYVIVSS